MRAVIFACTSVALLLAPLSGFAADKPPMKLGPATRPSGEPAKSVVFVLDMGGAMIQEFDGVRAMIKQAVASLTPQQSFNIVYCQDGKTIGFRNAVQPATEELKKRAETFLNGVVPHGEGDVMTPLKAATRMGPEVVYVLSQYERRGEKGYRPPAGVTVNVITFGFGMDPSGAQVANHFLQEVATETKGFCVNKYGDPILKTVYDQTEQPPKPKTPPDEERGVILK